MPSASMKLSIVIPARNEERNIEDTINALRASLNTAAIPYEFVIVDDGSDDHTADIVTALSSEDARIRLVVNHGPHGFGRSVRAGLDVFTGNLVVITMADGSDSPTDVVKYYDVLLNRADCAFGSRWMRDARVYDYPRFKWLINRIVNHGLAGVFGVGYDDITNAFKGYRRYVIEGCRPLISPHFNLTVELPLKAIVRGYTYEAVPISWRNRRFGQSSLHLEEMGSRYLYSALSVWLERALTRGDFRRPAHEEFRPWDRDGDSRGRA